MSNRYLSIKKSAGLIDVSERTIRRWVADRRIRSYRFGGAIRIKEDDLLNFAVVYETVEEKVNKIFSTGD